MDMDIQQEDYSCKRKSPVSELNGENTKKYELIKQQTLEKYSLALYRSIKLKFPSFKVPFPLAQKLIIEQMEKFSEDRFVQKKKQLKQAY